MINQPKTPIDHLLHFCIHNRMITIMVTLLFIIAGIFVAPFDWKLPVDRSPVPVDAIPDLGENQQILFTEWEGRSPQDVENQITYPLTVSMMGLSGVKNVRSFSMSGFSSLYLIFDDSVKTSSARTRVLERLSSLSDGTMPAGVKPKLGPDATGLGQVFWYTLEGRDKSGKPSGGWDLSELRSLQDWTVRYELLGVSGVAEVASVGGMVREFQVEVDPRKLQAHGVTLMDVYSAIRESNRDAGAQTIELNSVSYLIRGAGLVKTGSDLEKAVVTTHGTVPVTVGDLARVIEGPGSRMGILDKAGTEAVGGVVVVRDGANPMTVISEVKQKIAQIAHSLPSKKLADGTESRVTIVPFYDRSGLIRETLATLNDAIYDEILITMLVVIFMVGHIGSSLIISAVLPLAVLGSFIAMKFGYVDANIVSLSGIAIAIGTVVDMGVVLTENFMRHRDRPENRDKSVLTMVYESSSEVGGAIMAAIGTTLIAFLPIFFMEGAEGKLFIPLAFTKTFALIASIVAALTILPVLLTFIKKGNKTSSSDFQSDAIPLRQRLANNAVLTIITILLAIHWRPLGYEHSFIANLLFTAFLAFFFLIMSRIFIITYPKILRWMLSRKALILVPVTILVALGFSAWIGLPKLIPAPIMKIPGVSTIAHQFPGFSKEFMPPLDEGAFLFMPTAMTHGSIGAVHEILAAQDKAISAVPEVESVVGKLGRAESALDPAPAEMIETVINIKPEYRTDSAGHVERYLWKDGTFQKDSAGNLIRSSSGKPYRNWRDSIRSMDQIWDEITAAAAIPGVTSAPKLMPIAARIVMLQSGMRAPMGIKIFGPDLASIDRFSQSTAELLKQNPLIEPNAVIAERVVGKPYLDIQLQRDELIRYGLRVETVQSVIESAIGGMAVSTVIDGRERYNITIRYPRELRGVGDPSALANLPIVRMEGGTVLLGSVADITYRRGPQMVKSEDGKLVSYLLFDKKGAASEVDAALGAKRQIEKALQTGSLKLPDRVSWELAGNWENQVRAQKRLAVLLPIVLLLIFLVLYLQFRKVSAAAMVFTAVIMAWSGGFLLLWCYNQPWFLDIWIGSANVRDILNIHPVNLSLAIWVGFLALFGMATDDGILITTYLEQKMAETPPQSKAELFDLVVSASNRRIRAAQMTAMTTIIAMIPLLTASGRGSDIMGPMAIPGFGGLIMALLTIYTVPILYCWLEEQKLKRKIKME